MASLSKCSSSFLWSIVLCCFLLAEVNMQGYTSGTITLEILLTGFSNPQNRDEFGECCDGKKDSVSCTDNCDVFFAVCVPASSNCVNSDTILRNSSEFVYSHGNLAWPNGSSSGNFLSISFDTMPTKFTKFLINFYDNDSDEASPGSGNRSLIKKYSGELPTLDSNGSIHQNFSKNNISFDFLYRLRLKCKRNYYGELCSTQCEGRDDKYGHTKCLADGKKVCLPGWSGRKCDKPLCPLGCVNGKCQRPNYCQCRSGWRGASCEECKPDSKCLHATCTKPHSGCDCEPDWIGQHCNIYLHYCADYDPCIQGTCRSHDKSRNFTCVCKSGWTGEKCETFMCPTCNMTNAVCTSKGRCSCKDGWTGPNCNKCLPSINCTHGNCNRPFECVCEEGWGGENCNDSLPKSFCGQRNPCQNDGECIDVANGNYRCECRWGFTGRNCQIKDPCLTSCNTSRGYCEDNECRCHLGWQGPNCTECVRNVSCDHGYCHQPFECICEENWVGALCNISRNATNEDVRGPDEGDSDMDQLFYYIPPGVLVLLAIVCLLCLLWMRRRRRRSFALSSDNRAIRNSFIPSYIIDNNKGNDNEFTLNNNIPSEPEFTKHCTSAEIVLNPIILQASQNSKSMLIDNGIVECNGAIQCNGSSSDNSPDSSEYCVIITQKQD